MDAACFLPQNMCAEAGAANEVIANLQSGLRRQGEVHFPLHTAMLPHLDIRSFPPQVLQVVELVITKSYGAGYFSTYRKNDKNKTCHDA